MKGVRRACPSYSAELGVLCVKAVRLISYIRPTRPTQHAGGIGSSGLHRDPKKSKVAAGSRPPTAGAERFESVAVAPGSYSRVGMDKESVRVKVTTEGGVVTGGAGGATFKAAPPRRRKAKPLIMQIGGPSSIAAGGAIVPEEPKRFRRSRPPASTGAGVVHAATAVTAPGATAGAGQISMTPPRPAYTSLANIGNIESDPEGSTPPAQRSSFGASMVPSDLLRPEISDVLHSDVPDCVNFMPCIPREWFM